MIAIKIEPGKGPVSVDIENSLESLQKQVGGYIEVMHFAHDVALICDEEGKLKGKPYNFGFCGEVFVGTVLIVGVDGEEFCSLTANAEKFLLREFGRMG